MVIVVFMYKWDEAKFSKIVALINVTWSRCIKYSVFLFIFFTKPLFRAVVVKFPNAVSL